MDTHAHDATVRLIDADGTAVEDAVCKCGKDIEDCACLNGHECTCGGDPRLCGAQTVEIGGLSPAAKPQA